MYKYSRILLGMRFTAYAIALAIMILACMSFCHPIDSPFELETIKRNIEYDMRTKELRELAEKHAKDKSEKEMTDHMKASNDRWCKENDFKEYSGDWGTIERSADRSRDRDQG